MKLQSHYHDDAKFYYDPQKHGKQTVTKICKCPVQQACYVLIRRTSKSLLKVGFIDGHEKKLDQYNPTMTKTVIYFN